MGLSKRRKAMRLAEQEQDRRFQEYRRRNPLPPPTWTDGQLAEMDKMRAVLDKLIYGQSQDIDLVSDLLRFSYLFEGYSLRLFDLGRKVAHYRELEQYAAKEKLWRKIYDVLYGLQTELHLLRNSRDRSGTGVQ